MIYPHISNVIEIRPIMHWFVVSRNKNIKMVISAAIEPTNDQSKTCLRRNKGRWPNGFINLRPDADCKMRLNDGKGRHCVLYVCIWVSYINDPLSYRFNEKGMAGCKNKRNCKRNSLSKWRLVGWVVVFYVPSTARSFRDGTPIYCPLWRTWSSVLTPFPLGIELWAVVCIYVGWLRFTSHRQRCHLETALPITVPCEGREARVFTPFPPGIEPRAVAWQSITLPPRHASSTPCEGCCA